MAKPLFLIRDKMRCLHRQDPHRKWSPNWEGPYVVKKAFSRGALILAEMDGKEFYSPINADIVKKYYT